jgi:hypothetical protein
MEADRNVVPEELGPDPRAWARAMAGRFEGRKTPDETVLYGWFAEAMRMSAEKALAARKETEGLAPISGGHDAQRS